MEAYIVIVKMDPRRGVVLNVLLNVFLCCFSKVC
jgi:hypothetical protein